MNFEDIDKHVNSLGTLPPLQPHLTSVQASAQLCTYYKAVKPILVMVSTFPFFPARWKTVINGFVTVLDLMCP